MKNLKISMNDIQMEDALAQIDVVSALTPKEKNCLRLLTEEMFSMMENVLQNREATFDLEQKGTEFKLGLSANVNVSQKAKDAYMSMAADGKNLAHKGIAGKIVAILDSLVEGAPYVAPFDSPMGIAGDYDYMWTMSNYMDIASEEEKELDWDGMERSIIANFADDVMIGVRSNSLQMIVKKAF